jgi:CTP:molybdopterin cytidylyltransferase MocA
MSSMASGDVPNVAFAAVVPAAGRAERFGGKSWCVWTTLLDRTLDCLLSAGAAQVIVVAADPAELSPVVRLRHPNVRVVVNPFPDRGMFSSIQIGLGAVGDVDQVLVLPGDMPFVRVDTVARVAAEGSRLGQPVTLTFEGRRASRGAAASC